MHRRGPGKLNYDAVESRYSDGDDGMRGVQLDLRTSRKRTCLDFWKILLVHMQYGGVYNQSGSSKVD